MATSFLKAVKSNYPESQLDVIMTKGLTDLKFFMPYIDHVYEFSKKEFSGAIGNYKFGRMIAKNDTYDLFFCLPFSFSSAIVFVLISGRGNLAPTFMCAAVFCFCF